MNPIQDIINGVVESIDKFFADLLNKANKSMLDNAYETYTTAIKAVKEQVSQTPQGFSASLLHNIKLISDTAILPVAGVLLTYIFCYELYIMITEKNKGGNDVGFGEMLMLIIKTGVGIKLVANSFTITLALFDLGKWITDKIPISNITTQASLTEKLVGKAGTTGEALTLLFISFICMLVTAIMVGIIFLVAWSRIILIYLYIAVAPLPFATFMNRDWIGSIAQNYIKNLLALMLQGFFMFVCLVIYAGILQKVSTMVGKDANMLYTVTMFLVSMAVLVLSLTRTHSYAKSVVGAI